MSVGERMTVTGCAQEQVSPGGVGFSGLSVPAVKSRPLCRWMAVKPSSNATGARSSQRRAGWLDLSTHQEAAGRG